MHMNMMAERRKSLMPDPVKKAEYPRLAEFAYKYADIPGYQRTYVPGESELTARLLGIDPKYDYKHTLNPVTEQFREDELKDPKLWETYIEQVWKSVGDAAYDPSESPLIEVEPNVYEANPNTKAGKRLQRRWDLAYSRARHARKDRNPDRDYQLMLKGEEPLLGDVYFDEEGSFEDVWNISLDEHEFPMGSLGNIMRTLGSPLLEANQPIVRGKATYRGYK